MDRARILIADDEPSIRKVLKALLSREGHQADLAVDGAQAMERCSEITYDLVITDLRMPGADGMEVLAWNVQHNPGVPVIILTAFGTVDSAVESIKLGAFDYITKPFDHSALIQVVRNALAHSRLSRRSLCTDGPGRARIMGQTPGMRQVYDRIERVAGSPTTVLILGESGTGKEMVARALHERSPRADRPFIHVNCGAIPANLFESELFGYDRGAFTGAVGSKPGRFELADGGTLLLDEVGELPRDMQVKLLRVLQERSFERVGGLKTLSVDVRVVAATNVDLAQEVKAGRFREDLYWRLNVVTLHIPPLRERVDDIPLLVTTFVERFNRRLHRTIQGVSSEGLAWLMARSWPGNVRELENVLERAVLLADGPVLTLQDLEGPVGDPSGPEPRDLKELVRAHTAVVERTRIREVLAETDGNVTHAARKLGISRKSLQTKMREYGLREDGAGPVSEPGDERGLR